MFASFGINALYCLKGVGEIALTYDGKPKAILANPEFYEHRKEERCSRQWGTSNKGHPYIKVSRLLCKMLSSLCLLALALSWLNVGIVISRLFYSIA